VGQDKLTIINNPQVVASFADDLKNDSKEAAGFRSYLVSELMYAWG
jgi:hypothetical protein